MKYFVAPLGKPQSTLDEIRCAMISEFRKPQFESQCITEIKEIKKDLKRIVWDFDQQLKTLMAKVSFHMSDV